MLATPREPPQQAWLTPREPGGTAGGKGDAGTLKLAGLGALTQSFRSGYDVAPSVRAGGKAGELGEGGLQLRERSGLHHDIIVQTPRTPDNLSDVRQRHRQRGCAGDITVHWGLKDASIPKPGKGYGVKSNKDEDVAQNFKSGQRLGVAEYMQSRGEAIYSSATREPLGKPWVRGHRLPDDSTVFGCPSARNDYTAKESIFPRGVKNETEEDRSLYRKTHGSFDPGEMYRREYEWPKVVKENPHFRFGSADGVDTSNRGVGAKTALTMDAGEVPHGVPLTQIGKATQEHYRLVASDHLARPRNLLQIIDHLPNDHTHGLKSGTDNVHAGALMRGFYSDAEQLPDVDLAKCTVPGRRNFATQNPFGVPTVRSDKVPPHPHKRSVANATNYGDDADAMSLIFPGKFQFQGIHDEDFQRRRSKEELESILTGSGHSLAPDDYQQVFQAAANLHADGNDSASIEALMIAYSDFIAANARPQ